MERSLPHLPGYRSNSTAAKPRKQQFRYVNGYAVERAPAEGSYRPAHTLERAAEAKRELSERAEATGTKRRPELPQWLAHHREVLQFDAFFKEAVHDSPLESYRVRYCVIFYYLEDGTMQVSEPRQVNSGMPQGIFVKRHKFPKDADSYYELPDMNVGADVTIYGRTFHIYDCNKFTRDFLVKADIEVPPAEAPPTDRYTATRADVMRRETGADSDVYRGILTNPTKTFVEARLGKFVRHPDVLRKFLRGDRKVLRFNCAWDDRTSMFGRVHRYKLHYYLADDTVELVNSPEANSGEDPFARMLARTKLPKDHERAIREASLSGSETVRTPFYSWTDFKVRGGGGGEAAHAAHAPTRPTSDRRLHQRLRTRHPHSGRGRLHPPLL